jgi:hypothetical protein
MFGTKKRTLMRYLFLSIALAFTPAAALAAVTPDRSVSDRHPDVVPRVPKLTPEKRRVEPPPLEDALSGTSKPDPAEAARECSKIAGRHPWTLSSTPSSKEPFKCSILLEKPDK